MMPTKLNEILGQALDLAMKNESVEFARLIARLMDHAEWDAAEDQAYLEMLERDVQIARERYTTAQARLRSEKLARTNRLENA